MALKKITFLSVVFGFSALCFSFLNKKEATINLSYSLNYKGDSWEKQKTGLLWTLSYLGAELPRGSFDRNIVWLDSNTFTINFDKLGFNQNAVNVLNNITDSLEQSEEYITNNSIDLSMFVTLTIGSSWHYYAITGVPLNYQNYISQHPLSSTSKFRLSHSTVSKHNRWITFNNCDSVINSVFIAEEGLGDIIAGNFEPKFFEVMDVMSNGQLRFAIYNKEGNLTDASPKELGASGKPAKCIWCHEIVFQPLFVKTDNLIIGLSPDEFQTVIKQKNANLNSYRSRLNSDIDFTKTQDHTAMELLYISYMEPSLQKLSSEWNINANVLKRILKQEITHQHNEFDYLIDLYDRKKIQTFAPYKKIDLPDDVREPSKYEPNFIHFK